MTILQAFEALYSQVYQTGSFDISYDALQEYFFPSDPNGSGHPTWRDLSAHFGDRSHETYRANINKFKNTLGTLRNSTLATPVVEAFIVELTELYKKMEGLGYFALSSSFSNSLGFQKSLIGILSLGELFGFPEVAHVVSVEGCSYWLPKDLTQSQIDDAYKQAKRTANYYGSVYPYAKLDHLEFWQVIPNPHRIRFAKELLSCDEGFLELGDGDYFGFTNFGRDRLLSRLIQIYSMYEYVPDENLIDSLYRTIKKRVLSDSTGDVSILGECAEVFDEFCIKAGYILVDRNYRSASPKLKVQIISDPPTGEMYEAEKNISIRIRKYGEPMQTKMFVELTDELNANKSHLMEFAGLFYRKGYKRNSTYHTLDDRYNEQTGSSKELQPTERARIEVNRIYRNLRWAKRVKRLCNNRCQICGTAIQIGDDEYYSEAHHIQPLGEPHDGPDIIENMLCVCPNHHVMLDYGGIGLENPKLLFTEEHPVSQVFIDYHNHNIFNHE